MQKLIEIFKNKWAVPAGMLGVFIIAFIVSKLVESGLVVSIIFIAGMAGVFVIKSIANKTKTNEVKK